MKKICFVITLLLVAVFTLSACGPATQEVAPVEDAENQASQSTSNDAVEDNSAPDAANESGSEDGEEAENAATEVSIDIAAEDFSWNQDYITEIPPIMMIDPYFQIFGQSQGPVPYTYETAVKLSGHSCGATAGAWTIARKALRSALSWRGNPGERSNLR